MRCRARRAAPLLEAVAYASLTAPRLRKHCSPKPAPCGRPPCLAMPRCTEMPRRRDALRSSARTTRCFANLRPAEAALCLAEAPLCRSRSKSPHIRRVAIQCLGSSLQCLGSSLTCHALPKRNRAMPMPSQCRYVSPRLADATICQSSLRLASPMRLPIHD